MTLIHSAGELNHLPALFTCHLDDAANGPIAKQVQYICHDTLPWLISISLERTYRMSIESDIVERVNRAASKKQIPISDTKQK
jgi:hypothetical protein